MGGRQFYVAVTAWEVKQTKIIFQKICIIFLFMCICVCLRGFMPCLYVVPQRPEEGIISIRPGVTGSYNLTDVGTGN